MVTSNPSASIRFYLRNRIVVGLEVVGTWVLVEFAIGTEIPDNAKHEVSGCDSRLIETSPFSDSRVLS